MPSYSARRGALKRKKGATANAVAPYGLVSTYLEDELRRELRLTRSVEHASCTGRGSEKVARAGVWSDAGIRMRRGVAYGAVPLGWVAVRGRRQRRKIGRVLVVNAEDVLVVEQIEGLNVELKARLLGDREVTGDARINVPQAGAREEVACQLWNANRSWRVKPAYRSASDAAVP
jgi:hypothetical protein